MLESCAQGPESLDPKRGHSRHVVSIIYHYCLGLGFRAERFLGFNLRLWVKVFRVRGFTVEARKLEHHDPHALRLKYKGS